MNTNDITRNQCRLKRSIELAIYDAIEWITDRCTPKKPQEPDYVAALSIEFVKNFFEILVKFFPDHDFSVLGVFCHQKPIVDIKQGKKPELGDILFVYIDRKENGEEILNSLLLQAKISEDSSLQVKQNEKHQLELYKKWPKFTYYRAGNLNGETRNIFPKTINDGAQYLLIADDPLSHGFFPQKGMFQTRCPRGYPLRYPMGCAIPDDNLCINDSLSDELVNLLKFKSGRTFDSDKKSTEDDWSKMIWDLLEIAAFKYSSRKNAKLESFPRSSGYKYENGKEYSHFYTNDMGNWTLLDRIENEEKISDEDCGVSVVLIESRLKHENVE